MTRTVRRPAAPDPAHGSERDPAPVRILLAFAAIYLVWGSTYLAIRWAIETMPPLLMGGTRFLVAGGLLFIWARSRGAPAPTRVQWRASAIAGGLMLAGGTGAVMFAQQWVPSGLAALLIASMPLWLVYSSIGPAAAGSGPPYARSSGSASASGAWRCSSGRRVSAAEARWSCSVRS